ncbi:hypothetical protein G3I40_05260 [Streptomyces sp. SID14478]|uniref:hypothetical protein n=1 Tax=Streptomyces sp. SID14478 TaxID=2706073 RepID=UPI0013DCE5D6|nr:hypothetical protein [Streptomyces sp. SID14478]NEB74642.1 hypothetical protein [Streptomyces sp. SID14478]
MPEQGHDEDTLGRLGLERTILSASVCEIARSRLMFMGIRTSPRSRPADRARWSGSGSRTRPN